MRSLRGRIVLIVFGVLVLGLGGAIGATFGAVQDWSNDRDDAVLVAAGRQTAKALTTGEGLVQPGSTGHPDGVWQSMAERGEVPSFFAVYDANGSMAEVIAHGQQPTGAETLDEELIPGSDGEALSTQSGWLLHASALPEGQTLVVAMRTDISGELIGRTRAVAITCSVVGILGACLLAGIAVRRQMRPLDAMATTAERIGNGDLSQRVSPADDNDEVGRLAVALNGMLSQLEEAFSAKERSERRVRQFVSDASHELRTPVAMIRGHAELFRRGAADRPVDLEMVMSRIEETAQRMGSLIEEMLLLASLDEHRPLQLERVALVDIVTEAVADARAVEPGRAIELDASHVPLIEADAQRLRQVMTNLLANVRQHTPAHAPAAMRVRQDGEEVLVEIRDTGPGLTESQASRAFERFYRVDQPDASPASGSGLGLAIVTAIVEAHGGQVTLDSRYGEGATVQLRLPLTATHEESERNSLGFQGA